MGLFTAPWHALLWIFEEIAERAERELYDPAAVTAELASAYEQLASGALDEEEFARRENELVSRLEEIAARNARRAAGGA